MLNKNTRWIAGSLGLCGALLLGGCAAPVGGYADYGYASPAYGGYSGYSRPYYDPSPVVVPAPVYIQGGYYDSPRYYGRPGYYGPPGGYGRPGYDGRPGRPDPGYRPGGRPGGGWNGGGRPGRGNPSPQQLAPSVHPSPVPDRSMPIESQRILQERASGAAP